MIPSDQFSLIKIFEFLKSIFSEIISFSDPSTTEELSKLMLTLSIIAWSNGLSLTSANCLGNPILLELPAAKITAAFKTILILKLNHRMLVQ